MFLTIEQNNSGGYYIEADNIEEAKRRLADIADNYDESQNEHSFYEYCNCCGDRWDIWYKDGTDLFEVPSIDEKPIKECYHFASGYIHYKTGVIQYFQTRNSK